MYKTLIEKRAKLIADARKLLDTATAEKRSLDAAQQEQFDKMMNDADALLVEAQRAQRLETAEATGTGRVTTPNPTGFENSETRSDNVLASKDYSAAFDKYIRFSGRAAYTPAEHRAIELACGVREQRAGNIANQGSLGADLIAPQLFVDQLIQAVDNMVFLRQLATKYKVPTAQSLGIPSRDADVDDADWTSELATGNVDAGLKFGKRELFPRPLAKRLLISKKLLRAAPDSQNIVRERLAYKHGISQEKAFMTGTGAGQPLGIFTPSANGISTGRDITSASTTVIAANELFDVYYSLKQQYMQSKGLRWFIHRLVLATIRKLKDSNNQYLWQPAGFGSNLQNPMIDTLLNVPIIMSEYAPSALTAAQYVALLGDCSHYVIADALDPTIEVANELYIETNQTLFVARSEVDGMPVLEEAFARLILHA